jgi:ABC-type transport system involved in cytochrome bd biosynthesis fused ATPase/permease subunit
VHFDAIAAALRLQPSAGPFLSLDDLLAILVAPFLVVGVVIAVVENLLGSPEYRAAAAAGVALLGLALLVPPELNLSAAYAIRRELGWRIGLQVGSPISLYWGLLAVLMLLGAHEGRREYLEDSGE